MSDRRARRPSQRPVPGSKATSEWKIAIADRADPSDESALRGAVTAFNFDVTGYRDGRSLSCFLRDESGRLVAGIDGFTWGGYAKIEYLWVDAPLRGQGLGRRLLQAAIDEATTRGCRSIVVDTHTFQAPGLYPKLGFVEIGRSADTPVGHGQVFFQRRLP
jgi:ribosomal protein S18 acetylase RimI-like enzyme